MREIAKPKWLRSAGGAESRGGGGYQSVSENGGRSRDRTYDPLIKRKQGYIFLSSLLRKAFCYNPFEM